MTVSRRDARYALAVLFAINLLNFFDRTLGAALAEPVRKEFGLSDQQLGLLATIFTLAYAVVGLPLGRLTDTRTRTKLVAVGVTFWSIVTAATGGVWNFASMVGARIGVGLGEAICAPAGQSLIGDYFPPERRARAMAFFMAGLPLGLFAVYMVAGAIAARWGWRVAFLLASVPGLLTAVLALRMKEPPRGATEMHAGTQQPITSQPFRAIARIGTLRWIVASGAGFNFHSYATNSFTTAYLMRFHGLGLRQAGQISAVSLGLVGLLGLIIGGALGDRLRKRRPNGRLLLAAVAFLLAAPCVFLALEQPRGHVAMFAALMGTMTVLTMMYYATVYSAIQDIVEPRLRGAAVALYFFAMYVFGASFGPVIVGGLSDRMAKLAMHAANATVMTEPFKASGLHSAMYAIPVALLFTSVVLFFAARTVGADMERMQERLRASFQ